MERDLVLVGSSLGLKTISYHFFLLSGIMPSQMEDDSKLMHQSIQISYCTKCKTCDLTSRDSKDSKGIATLEAFICLV